MTRYAKAYCSKYSRTWRDEKPEQREYIYTPRQSDPPAVRDALIAAATGRTEQGGYIIPLEAAQKVAQQKAP